MARNDNSPTRPAEPGEVKQPDDPKDSVTDRDAPAQGGRFESGEPTAPPRRIPGRQSSLVVPKPAYVIYEESLARRKGNAGRADSPPGDVPSDEDGMSFLPQAPDKTPRATMIRRWIYFIIAMMFLVGLRAVERGHWP